MDGGMRHEVEQALAGTSLAAADHVWVPAFDELPILQVTLQEHDVLLAWTELRTAISALGWSVVATTDWGHPGPADMAEIVHRLRDRDWIASSSHARQGPAPSSFAPDDLLAAASAWTDQHIDARLDELEWRRDAQVAEVWAGDGPDALLAAELEQTRAVAGTAPEPDDVPTTVRAAASQLDRWLLDWELAHADPPTDRVQDWFRPTRGGGQPVHLWVLASPAAFAAVAIDHWWESDLPFDLAVLQRWHRRWGAELVAHWGTMLQVTAERLPTTVDDAWGLAREQHLLCDALLEPVGESRRHLALGLMHTSRWFLHSRP